MKQLTEILPGIYVVEVPKDAVWIGKMVTPQYIGDWQILGTATRDEISFDVLKEFGISEDDFRKQILLDEENEPVQISKRDYKLFPGGKPAAQKFNEEQYENNKLQGILVVLKKVNTTQ